MSEQLFIALKAQIMSSSDPEQAKEALAMLEIYGYKALPVLRDLMQECDKEEIRNYCKEAIKKLGWLPDES